MSGGSTIALRTPRLVFLVALLAAAAALLAGPDRAAAITCSSEDDSFKFWVSVSRPDPEEEPLTVRLAWTTDPNDGPAPETFEWRQARYGQPVIGYEGHSLEEYVDEGGSSPNELILELPHAGNWYFTWRATGPSGSCTGIEPGVFSGGLIAGQPDALMDIRPGGGNVVNFDGAQSSAPASDLVGLFWVVQDSINSPTWRDQSEPYNEDGSWKLTPEWSTELPGPGTYYVELMAVERYGLRDYELCEFELTENGYLHGECVIKPLFVGVNDDGANGLIDGRVEPPGDPCLADLTVESGPDSVLWGEVRTEYEGISPPISRDDALSESGLLAPGGYLPMQWASCFTGPNQSFTITVDTTTVSAELMQLAEILWAVTGTSLYGSISDLRIASELAAALPPSFVSELAGCGVIGPGAVSCALRRSMPAHPGEWRDFYAMVLEKAGEAFVVKETRRALETLGAPDWHQAQQYLQQFWEKGVIAPALDADLDHVGDELAEKRDRRSKKKRAVKRAKRKAQDAKDGLQVRREVLEENRDQLQELKDEGATKGKIKRREKTVENNVEAVKDARNKLLKKHDALDLARGSLANVRKAVQELGESLRGLKRLARSLPALGVLVESATAAADKIARARSGQSSGRIVFVSCTEGDQRPACATGN